MSADVQESGINEGLAMLRRIEPAIDASLLAIGEEARDRVAPYPQASHKKQAFKTLKQRRGFFARLKSGQIKVPYPRSGDTLARWSQPVRTGKNVVLRNTSPHAKWTHGAKTQTKYHAGNWQTDQDVAEQIVGDGTAARIVEQAVQHAVGN